MNPAYFTHLGVIAGIYIILSCSLNLALGYTGLLNLGHVAFYAIGAYTSGILTTMLGLPFWVGFLAGGALAAVFGAFLAYPTVKLKGDYLALGTLGFSIIIESVLKNWNSVTNGPMGITAIPKPVIFGLSFGSLSQYFLLVIIVMVVCFFVLQIITKSPFGRILKATRDDEIATKTLGKNTFVAKAKALALSAFFAGIAGSLYAHYISFIDPTSFSLTETILIFSMVLIGGTGSLWGSAAGAILMILLPEPLRFLPFPSSIIGGMRQALYALLLVLVIRWRPQGLIGKDTFHKWKRGVKR